MPRSGHGRCIVEGLDRVAAAVETMWQGAPFCSLFSNEVDRYFQEGYYCLLPQRTTNTGNECVTVTQDLDLCPVSAAVAVSHIARQGC